jgi:predicted nucleic-acid-binding protein
MRNIDSNVFLRFLTTDKEKMPKSLLNFFSKLENGETKVFCLEFVFFQVIFVLKSFYKVEKEEIINKMLNLLSFEGLYMKDKRVIERTLEMWRNHPGDIIDCYIAANMEKSGEKEIVSYDKKIEKLGLQRIEP